MIRLVTCGLGICLSYWFYGFLQETLLTKTNLGATFMLVLQTIANVFVALIWKDVEERMVQSPSSSTSKMAKQNNNKSLKDLNHALLILISSTYVFAMVASNESLQFVPYPTAVLAKSCKLIPTMVMGTLVERRQYSSKQWLSSISISVGIAMFNLSRIQHQEQQGIGDGTNDHNDDTPTDDQQSDELKSAGGDETDHYWKGMALLFLSLCMDGFLGSFQGILKKASTTSASSDETKKRTRRPPTAVESMLFVNLYALLFLVPMSMISGQWKQGMELLFLQRQDNEDLLFNVCLLNGVVSIGQIFIFLTITWYSSLVSHV